MGAAKTTPLLSYTYTLGAAGNRKTVAELSGRTVQYGYDSLYRLTSETVTAHPANHNGLTTYTYDSVGNRTVLKMNGVTVNTYNYDANDRLTSDVYDNDGNTTSSTGITNAYDFENHLIQHGAVTVAYDGDGNRVSETVGGVATKYLVDTQNPTGYAQVVDELVAGSVTRTYAYGLAGGRRFRGFISIPQPEPRVARPWLFQGREAMHSTPRLNRSVVLTFPIPPFAKCAKNGAPEIIFGEVKIKTHERVGHPPACRAERMREGKGFLAFAKERSGSE